MAAKTLNPVTFIKEARTELGRVVWPTRAETVRLTLVVIGVSLGIGIFIGGLDIILVKLTGILIK